MDRQEIYNALCAIEDEARKLRNEQPDVTNADFAMRSAFDLIARLTQIIRQEKL